MKYQYNPLLKKLLQKITGDVFGPAASTDENIALFGSHYGKLIKDSGKQLSNSANNIPVLDASALLPLAQLPAHASAHVGVGGDLFNSANLLSGITPTFAGWNTNPGTDADIVNELTLALTTAGRQTNNTISYITYDLGASIRFIISSNRSSVATSASYTIESSDDDVNWYEFAQNVAGTTVRAVTGFTKARYVRAIFGATATGNTITQLGIRAYRV